jgi:hypothetical protein
VILFFKRPRATGFQKYGRIFGNLWHIGSSQKPANGSFLGSFTRGSPKQTPKSKFGRRYGARIFTLNRLVQPDFTYSKNCKRKMSARAVVPILTYSVY